MILDRRCVSLLMVCVRISVRLFTVSLSISSVVLPEPATAKITLLAMPEPPECSQERRALLHHAVCSGTVNLAT